MIDQGLAAAVLTFASVLAGVGAVVLLALAAWAVGAPLAARAQRRTAAAERLPLRGTPHPAH